MGANISFSDYQKVSRFLTRPASFVRLDRYTRVWEKSYFGEPIQFIHKYTDPQRLLVIVGERTIKFLIGL